jgi:hypothetical protein
VSITSLAHGGDDLAWVPSPQSAWWKKWLPWPRREGEAAAAAPAEGEAKPGEAKAGEAKKGEAPKAEAKKGEAPKKEAPKKEGK